jgi:citrate synthase
MKHQFEGFPRSAPPMAILSAMINSLSCFHPELHEIDDHTQFRHAAARLISVERRLYPNVDFYSGILLRAMGIPTNMFTVIFAIGRLPGWIAQWWEQNRAPGARIARPRQIYVGATLTDFVSMDQRG